ncbi:hypothetical protein [Candidatus Oleimmundimicrobium sp.]|uniref:hypothetical protein n=1 Tax=Candidatus Oleimmundimicrobium sp. TaxID=3060597 RepID=UPI002725E716|nr:hypothetical protein [Candidatus Oleimmundimicrobium sp.]MDO8886848.1 hypothetical protein [Candidatus Oleimmundimicrobium sp.]
MDIRQKYSGASRLSPQPWFKSTTWEPWEEDKASWVVNNKHRRQIISALATGPKKRKDLEEICLTFKPFFAKKGEVKIKISSDAITNHLYVLRESGLILQKGDLFELNLPFLPKENLDSLNNFVEELAIELMSKITVSRSKILKALNSSSLEQVLDPLLEKVVESVLKKLENKGDYKHEVYRRWIEEFDMDAFRDWVTKIKI